MIWLKKFIITSFVVLIGISTSDGAILFYLNGISFIVLVHVFLQIIYKPYEFDSLNNLEFLNLGLMTFIALFLMMTFEDWNPFITWVLFTSSLLVPLLIYLYLGVKYLFKEKYEKKEEGHVSKVIYFMRRNLDIKFKQLGQENGIDSQDRYVFSQDLNIWTSSPQEYEKTNGKEIENDYNRI